MKYPTLTMELYNKLDNEVMENIRTKITNAFSKIDFNEEEHIYTMNGKHPISVSTVLEAFIPEFEADKWANIKAGVYKTTPEEVKEAWRMNALLSCETGSKVHYELECYACSKYLPWKKVKELTIDEGLVDQERAAILIEQGKKWLDDFISCGWTLFDTELIMGSEELGYVGTADLIFYKDGRLHILDWKTNNKDINGKVYHNLLGRFSFVGDNTLSHYNIQLNLYKLLLETVTEVGVMGVVHLTPSGVDLYEVPDYSNELNGFKVYK